MTKAKLQRRPHKRVPKKASGDPAEKKLMDQAIADFDRAFRSKLPVHEASGQNPVSTGSYVQQEGDAFHEKEYPVADGKYRVEGSDWILTFEGGGFVEAERAEPPHYGGKHVIAVTPPNG